MSRGPAKFTQSDAERLLKAAAKAGVSVRVEFRSDRTIIATTAEVSKTPSDNQEDRNEWE
jgi:hypothetical protein